MKTPDDFRHDIAELVVNNSSKERACELIGELFDSFLELFEEREEKREEL